MPIPDFQSLMLPLLRHVAAHGPCTFRECVEALTEAFNLTEAERKQLLPSGRQTTFANRVGWAKTYQVKAGLLASPRRGVIEVTDRGREVLANPPDRITIKFLSQYQEFADFRNAHAKKRSTQTVEQTEEHGSPRKEPAPPLEAASTATGDGVLDGTALDTVPDVKQPQESAFPLLEDEEPQSTPEEALETAYQNLRAELADELLRAILSSSPAFFEQLVIDLLVRMGYGGTRKDAGQAIGKSHDGGIDGIIKEDRLGLDIIYVQAKRWQPDRCVGRPEIQQFVGALQGQRARKGVFITTSRFSSQAIDYVSRVDSKIALIDGEDLAQLMIDFGLGVTTINTYEVKRVDTDYFDG